MQLRILPARQGTDPGDRQFSELNKFCSDHALSLTFEERAGQFWLHSDNPKETPIGIEVDRVLQRHEDFFKRSSLHKELLARAIGIKGGLRPSVIDLSAGLLGDALMFLAFGCEVVACERHPVVRFLIESALQNAQHAKVSRLKFHPISAAEYLSQITDPEVIFFDPMFEDANAKTSPRKEMRIFRNVVGTDSDAEGVFHLALSKKPKRLVIKRPKQSTYLGKRPDVEYIGKSTRYDVYFSP